MSTFSIQSYHLNVDSGDSAIHVLVEESSANPPPNPKFVLVDGGYAPYGNFWIRKVCAAFEQRFNQPNGIKFDGIVVTHWDGDHYEGIDALFRADLQEQWAKKEATLRVNEDKGARWADFVTRDWQPAFCRESAQGVDTHIYVPYFTSQVKISGKLYTSSFESNTKAVFKAFEIAGQPPSWKVLPVKDEGTQAVTEFLVLDMENPYDKKKTARSKELAKVHYTSDKLLAYDFFTGEKALQPPTDWKTISDPSFVSKGLKGTKPVMFCVMADCVVCGREPPKKRKDLEGDYEWDLSVYKEPILIKKANHGVHLVPGSTTTVNQASIACMIIWPNKDRAIISHYFGGDLGDEVESMVIKWSTVPEGASDNIRRKRTHVYATKLSHHGAKQSTPKELFMAFQPKRMVVSNGMSKEWKHPKVEILVFIYAWKLFLEFIGSSETIQIEPDFEFRALNFPVYLGWCFDEQTTRVQIDPGSVKELKKPEFRKLVYEIAGKDATWFNETFGSSTDTDAAVKGKVVDFLRDHWEAIGKRTAEKYIGWPMKKLSTGLQNQYLALSRAGWQAIRAVCILQTADRVGMTDLTFKDLGMNYNLKEIPDPVERKKDKKTKEITLREHPQRARKQPQRFNPEIIKIEKKRSRLQAKLDRKEMQKKKRPVGLRDSQIRNMHTKVSETSAKSTIQLPQAKDPIVSKRIGISLEEKYFFVARGTLLDPPIQSASIASEATGIVDFLPYLEIPVLVFAKKPSPGTKTPIDPSDRLYQWFALLFKSGDNFSFLASATPTSIAALEFEMSLAATIKGHTRANALNSTALSSLLSFSTKFRDLALLGPPTPLVPSPPSDTPPSQTDVTLHQMLILGLDPRANGLNLTFGTICQFLECDFKLLSILKDVAFKLDAASDRAARNAIWLSPDIYYTTTMRLQFIASSADESMEWLHGILHEINPVSELKFPSPVRLVAKKQFRSQLPELDTYDIERSWELILKADVSLTNNKNVTRVVEIVLAFTPIWTRWTLFLTPPNSKESNSQMDSLDSLFEFLLGLLPSNVNLPTLKSLREYLPFSDHIFLRSLSIMSDDNGTKEYEVILEIIIASVTFLATLKLGQSPSFYAEIFQDPSTSWAKDLYQEFPYSPTWESHLMIGPQNKEHNPEQTSLYVSKLHGILTKNSRMALNELSKSQLGSYEMTTPPIGLEIISAVVHVDNSGFTFQGSMMDVSDHLPGATGAFPELDLGVASFALNYQNVNKALSMTAGISMDLVSRNEQVGSNVTICAQISYTQGDWTVNASVGPLTFSHLWDLFNSDCNDEILNILEQISIKWLSLQYTYHKDGDKSLTIEGELNIGPIMLDFDYNSLANKDWDFTASLNVNSPSIGISFLDFISSFCGLDVQDMLPDFLKTPNISLKSGGSASDIVAMRNFKLDTHFVFALEVQLTTSISIQFMHLQKKRDPPTSGSTEPNFPPPSKRLLLIKVDGLPAVISNIPFVSTMLQPFDEMDFLWVDGANDAGFTQQEVALLNKCFIGRPFSVPYKEPAKPEKADSYTRDIVLACGCHFMVIWNTRAIVDACLGKHPQQQSTLGDVQNLSRNTTDMAPIDRTIGPLRISELGLQVDPKELRVLTNAQASMGCFSARAIGLTMHVGLQNISFQDLSKTQIDLSVRGISLSLNAPPVSLAGVLVDRSDKEKVSYAGGAVMSLKAYSMIGFGSYSKGRQTNSLSFCAIAQVIGPLCAIGPLQLKGVKIGFGYNTDLRRPNLTTVYDFPFCVSWSDTALPMDMLDKYTSWFPESANHTWVALGLEAQLQDCLSIVMAIVLNVSPKVTLDIFGQGTFRIPAQAAPDKGYVNIQLGLISTIDFGAGSMLIEASLAPASFIVHPTCHLSGSFAIASWWSPSPAAGDWVVSIGGYHPKYTPRPHYPRADRLAIRWEVSDTISIYGSAYLSVTPDVLMAGATLCATFTGWGIHASFVAYADFLVNYAPFAFQADVGVIIEGSLTLGIGYLSHTFTARVAASVHLEGPPVHGIASINILSHSFYIAFGNTQVLEDRKLDFEKFRNLLMSTSQQNDYHMVNLESGALAPPPQKEKPLQDTVWNVRAATFRFSVQTLIPISTASVNSKEKARSTESNIYARPMQLRKNAGLKTSLEVLIKDDDGSIKSDWQVYCSEQWLPSNIWGECK